MQLIATENAGEIRDALLRAVRSLRYSVPVVQLMAHYVDGKPPDHVEVRTREIAQHDLSRLSNEELEMLERLLEKATPPAYSGENEQLFRSMVNGHSGPT
jgi:hypothetical protein